MKIDLPFPTRLSFLTPEIFYNNNFNINLTLDYFKMGLKSYLGEEEDGCGDEDHFNPHDCKWLNSALASFYIDSYLVCFYTLVKYVEGLN
jgi:hypothetical protein